MKKIDTTSICININSINFGITSIAELVNGGSNSTVYCILLVLSIILFLSSLFTFFIKLYYNNLISDIDKDIVENNQLISAIRSTINHSDVFNLILVIIILIILIIAIHL